MQTTVQNLVRTLKNLRHKINAIFWNAYYNHPSSKIKVIGVTGTDGKTTTSTIIYNILHQEGKKVALITTIAAKIGDKLIDTGFHVTNPTPRPLQKLLKEIVNEGYEYVVLETTSHGLDQYRVGGVEYNAAVFTNVTHEHLDYHKTYSNYLSTKSKLLDLLAVDGFLVVNKDDESFDYLSKKAKVLNKETITYGIEENSDYMAQSINMELGSSRFTLIRHRDAFDVELKLPGKYNIYNSLAAIATTEKFGVSENSIKLGLASTDYLEGRWEVMQEKPVKVVVDFAHTPNALEKVLTFARSDNSTGKIIVVFGCAGKRDNLKRPLMGEIAERIADITILTAEDPRGEDVNKINEEIISGMEDENYEVYSVPDRGDAIEKALEIAEPGDTVIVTGKGHEKSMNIDGKTETDWSDQLAIKRLLNLD